MKIADIHSFFVRRTKSGKKVSRIGRIVEASKDSLDEHPRQNDNSPSNQNEDAAVFEPASVDEVPLNKESEDETEENEKKSASTHLDLTV